MANIPLKAKWIWKQQESYTPYDQTIIAYKTFRLEDVARAVMRITTDGQYRLYVNGEWVSDGPCRSWPEHFQYDEVDVTAYLTAERNDVTVMARHWSVGNFHTVPQQAGLLAQLDVTLPNGKTRSIASDGTWQVAEATAWVGQAPKVSIQMEPQELYDARLEDQLAFEPAEVLYAAKKGPWLDLHPRDVALLARKPLPFRSFVQANLVRRSPALNFCLPASRLANPGLVEANRSTSSAGGMATLLELDKDSDITFYTEGFLVSVDGIARADGHFHLPAGRHLVLAFVADLYGHQKEKTLRLPEPPAALVNPLQAGHENPWCWLAFPEFAGRAGQENDLVWNDHPSTQRDRLNSAYQEQITALAAVSDEAAFQEQLGERAHCLDSAEMFVQDTHWLLLNRQVIGDAAGLVENPARLIYDNGQGTVVHPSPDGEMELVYDLGEQSVGYYDFDLISDEGVAIDIYGVEYIAPDGRVQHTWGNRNGLRYITRAGRNRFTSLKRRSGRYLFVTLRNQRTPVSIRLLQLIESTYPVHYQAGFECSDPRLERIWEISARTLKLCMEDTLTDCPLYEQTLWVGDARNESLYAYTTFGATDIGRRCIQLAAQSLERYPIVGCQVPSTWDCLLPAWSFLWGISVWDYYQFTGDRAFLSQAWPWVLLNLQGAAQMLDANGLFSGPYWNMFDWSGIDDRHETVLHNSLLLVGALNAAQQMAAVVGQTRQAAWLKKLRSRLAASINRWWDAKRKAYPDSIQDGTPSTSTSQHTSFLAVLYDVIEPANFAAAVENMLPPQASPPQEMVRVGSPFAMMYFYEALDKLGRGDDILASIYASYLPMLEAGATTVWEVFPASHDRPQDFPTRSHCHAWSAAPLHFLPRLVLGIRQTEPGGAAFEISPRLSGLTWARGTIVTAKGLLHVEWRVEGKRLQITVRAPQGTNVQVTPNDSMEGLEVVMK